MLYNKTATHKIMNTSKGIIETFPHPRYRGGPHDHMTDGEKKDGTRYREDSDEQMLFLPILPPLGNTGNKKEIQTEGE
jgi:hypothetical protein